LHDDDWASIAVTKYLGCAARRPYLCWLDTEMELIEPAAELRFVPQGIDEVVPLAGAVAVRCGPYWFGLQPDLSGQGRRLTPAEKATAVERSRLVDISAEWNGPAELGWHGRALPPAQHRDVAYWQPDASISPDEGTVAIVGSVIPRPPIDEVFDRPFLPFGEYQTESASVLALLDVASGDVQVCAGRFDGSCYPPVWSASGSEVAFGAPYEPKRLYLLDTSVRTLRSLKFRRHCPMPMLDAAFLPPQ
jgi:hypothetical protein